jgi:hypothetical protein
MDGKLISKRILDYRVWGCKRIQVTRERPRWQICENGDEPSGFWVTINFTRNVCKRKHAKVTIDWMCKGRWSFRRHLTTFRGCFEHKYLNSSYTCRLYVSPHKQSSHVFIMYKPFLGHSSVSLDFIFNRHCDTGFVYFSELSLEVSGSLNFLAAHSFVSKKHRTALRDMWRWLSHKNIISII